MIITLAFANGFQEQVGQKVFSFLGHIRIQEKQPYKSLIAEEIPITKNDSLVQAMYLNPQVTSIHAFATKYAIVKSKESLDGVLVKGFDKSNTFSHLKRFIVAGRPIQFNDSTYSREIMISQTMAQDMQLKLNDKIFISFFRPDGKPRPDRLTVVGIFKTGIEEYDKTYAIGDLKLLQRLNDWNPAQIGGYEVFLKDYNTINHTANELYALNGFPQTWDAISVRDVSPNIFDWLGMQDVTRNVLIGFMIAVAVINLITCLIVLVLERVRMIGVLKSMGATNWTIQKIFLFHSAYITISGIAAGLAAGLGLLFLQLKTGFIKLDETAYYLSEAAVKIVWWQVAAICIGTFIVCFLILIIPTLITRKVTPVKAIRFA